MAIERKENIRVTREGGYERKQRVVEQTPSMRRVIVNRLIQLVWLVAAVIFVVIGLRFILLMIAANQANAFANFIFGLSAFFVTPFIGLTTSPPLANGGVIEIASLIALAVYPLLGFFITQLLRILLGSSWGTRRVTTVEQDIH